MKVVIVNCFDTYSSRVDFLYNYFLNISADISVLTSDFQHIKKKYIEIKDERYKYIHVKNYKKNISFGRIFSHIEFVRRAIGEIKKIEPDILWVLIPPNYLCEKIAKYKAIRNEVKVIFDIIDVWPETMPIQKFERVPFYRKWRDLRQCNLECADALVVECDYYKVAIQNENNKKMINTLYLSRKYEQYVPNSKLSNDEINVCYLGSINNIVDISLIIETLRKIKKNVVLHIIGCGEKKQEFINSSRELGIHVEDYGEIYDMREKQAILRKCHFGINMMKSTVFVGLTMKSIDYMENGLPLLNNIPGDTSDLIKKYGIGINISKDIFEMEELVIDDCFFENDIRVLTRKVFEETFSPKKCERKLDDILRLVGVTKNENE